MKINQ